MKIDKVIYIFCNSKLPENIFPVATIMRKFRTVNIPILIIDVDPTLLGSEKNLKELLKFELSLMNFGYENSEDEEEIILDQSLFFLINIGPGNDREMASLVSFFEKHEAEISLWVDTIHDWLGSELRYFNHDHLIVHSDRNLLNLELLEKLKYQSPQVWKEAEKALAKADVDQLRNSPLAWRYLRVFYVSKVVGVNAATDAGDYNLMIFLGCVDELVFAERDDELDYLVALFSKTLKRTDTAKKRITDNLRVFRQAKEKGRPVGYLNIGNLPPYLNTREILYYGQKHYPWLFVLRYSIRDKDYMEATSIAFNVIEIINSYADESVGIEEFLKILNAEVLAYQARQTIT